MLKYTCIDCNLVTISKSIMNSHVELMHLPDNNEEVNYECNECKHEFSKEDDYNSHIKSHEDVSYEDNALENIVFLDILEIQIYAEQSVNISITKALFLSYLVKVIKMI